MRHVDYEGTRTVAIIAGKKNLFLQYRYPLSFILLKKNTVRFLEKQWIKY